MGGRVNRVDVSNTLPSQVGKIVEDCMLTETVGVLYASKARSETFKKSSASKNLGDGIVHTRRPEESKPTHEDETKDVAGDERYQSFADGRIQSWQLEVAWLET